MEALSYNRTSDILRNAIAKYEEQHYASGYAERYVHELVLAHFDITADEYAAITGRQF